MTISIITPSFNQPKWLRLCLSSVADQEGVEVEHIVQDNCSGPDVEALVPDFPNTRFVFEKDAGMYDAVNRGLRKSSGDICAYLNCDEQYLPGTLSKVVRYMDDHPEVDILLGAVIVTDKDGQYTCSRQVLKPLYYHTKVCHLNTFTAALFFRRRLLDDFDMYFDPKWKDLGDCAWMLRSLRKGFKMAVLNDYLSSFMDTGANMNLGANAQKERIQLLKEPPQWPSRLAPLWHLHHRLRRLVRGHYWPRPFSYAVYTEADPTSRRVVRVDRPTPIWRERLKPVERV